MRKVKIEVKVFNTTDNPHQNFHDLVVVSFWVTTELSIWMESEIEKQGSVSQEWVMKRMDRIQELRELYDKVMTQGLRMQIKHMQQSTGSTLNEEEWFANEVTIENNKKTLKTAEHTRFKIIGLEKGDSLF